MDCFAVLTADIQYGPDGRVEIVGAAAVTAYFGDIFVGKVYAYAAVTGGNYIEKVVFYKSSRLENFLKGTGRAIGRFGSCADYS